MEQNNNLQLKVLKSLDQIYEINCFVPELYIILTTKTGELIFIPPDYWVKITVTEEEVRNEYEHKQTRRLVEQYEEQFFDIKPPSSLFSGEGYDLW